MADPLLRSLIEGRLVTLTPLHVGDGEPISRAGLDHPETGEPIAVARVATDHGGRPILPGTAIKGVLRRWCECHRAPDELVRQVFGNPPGDEVTGDGEEDLFGGKAEFWDATIEPAEAPSHLPPWWDERRGTGVAARVAIDRRTRTAAEQRLFHLEYVPGGVPFRVTIAGNGLTGEELALLRCALAGIADGGEDLSFGSESAAGWGRMRWEGETVSGLDVAGLRTWVAENAPAAGYAMLRPLEADAARELDSVRESLAESLGRSRPVLRVDLDLRFDVPFLVNDNDPSRTGPGEKLPDHAPLCDAEGRSLLPSSSFRGAFRSQAERILRTAATVSAPEAVACLPTSGGACRAISRRKELARLCPACRLFGAAGWRSPIFVSDFHVATNGEGRAFHQDFVAIDRFTGGGAEVVDRDPKGNLRSNGLKFKASSYLGTRLSGRVELDLGRLAAAGCLPWALGLLALALRDLEEGDVGFGFGTAKGYGRCSASWRVTAPAWGELPEEVRGIPGLEPDLFEPAGWRVTRPDRGANRGLERAISELSTVKGAG